MINNIDLVIDLVGGDTGIRSFKTLQPKGRLITIPTNTRDQVLAHSHSLNYNACGMLAETNLSELNTLARLCEDGYLDVYVHNTFDLSTAYKAHELLETGHTTGKIALKCI